ncbi:MAG TPA: deoxynucleoside kinase [Candidatus Krumholzibacteria bacterium]|nr:deoxynucleoside kinase [Candidatus Krumholzibacteria bacterium]HPD71869.1 deoxynucleoside kinase [Candidatus Krumholzibacteria bacterium]HRY41198.1 deoxynucleoside kinase [Candidatus Krumholzibacteria bacterium]
MAKTFRQRFGLRQQPRTPFYVAVAGNIGVGKSMLTRLLGQSLGWPMYFEPVINNPYLDDYYKDMARWSFHLQVYFLSQRFAVQKQIQDHGGSAVQDRTIYEDVEIFAPTLHRRGCMDRRDYENYREIFRNMVAFLQAPDLIVYLWSQPEVTFDRIRKRGRRCELDIPLEFLQDLHAAYEDWIERAPAICPVETIDTERVNLRDDAAAQTSLLQLIAEYHREKHVRVTGEEPA